jgi:hypothetical protein
MLGGEEETTPTSSTFAISPSPLQMRSDQWNHFFKVTDIRIEWDRTERHGEIEQRPLFDPSTNSSLINLR